jgi:hypothetical protein
MLVISIKTAKLDLLSLFTAYYLLFTFERFLFSYFYVIITLWINKTLDFRLSVSSGDVLLLSCFLDLLFRLARAI